MVCGLLYESEMWLYIKTYRIIMQIRNNCKTLTQGSMVGLRTKLLPVQRQLLLSTAFPSAVLDPVEEVETAVGAETEAAESAAVAAVDAVLLVGAVDN